MGIEGEEQEAVWLHGDEGMKGCWVFTGNPELQGSLPQRMEVRRNGPKLCKRSIDPEQRLYRCGQMQRSRYPEAADCKQALLSPMPTDPRQTVHRHKECQG